MAVSDANRTTSTGQKLSLKVCTTFGIGTVGVSVVLNTVTAYFPALMSTVLGVAPGVAGVLTMAAKIYDIFADFLIGHASDRTRSRWGRRRPYLLAGAITAFVGVVMIFFTPPLKGAALLAYMAAGLIIHSTGYSLFNVPYLAMPAEMATTSKERLRLVSFRTAFIGIGSLLSLAVTALLIQAGGGGAAGYRLMAAVMAVIALAAMLTTFFGVDGAPTVERDAGGHGISWADIRSLGANRPLMLLMGAKLSQYLGLGILQSANLLFLLNVLKTGMMGMVHTSVVQNVVVFACMPAWVRLANSIGKRNGYILAVLILIPASVSWYWAKPGLAMWELWWRAAIFGVGSGGALLMSTSMLPDASEYDRLRTGRRREGLISSLYSLNEKFGFALSAGVMGIALSASGYIATTGGHIVQQSPQTIAALYFIKAFVPAIILGLGLILIWFYRLDQAALDQARAEAGQ